MSASDVRAQWRRAAGRGGVHFLILPNSPEEAHKALRTHAATHGNPQHRGAVDEAWTKALAHELTKGPDSGFSIHDHLGDGPSSGYMVSIDDTEQTHALSEVLADPDIIKDYYERHQSAMADPTKFFGAWIEGDRVFFDVSTHVTEAKRANDLGYQHHQIAYFDLQDFTSKKCVPPDQFHTSSRQYGRNPTAWGDQVLAMVREASH